MTNNNKNVNVFDFIDEQIGDLLYLLLHHKKRVNTTDVIDVLLEISDLIPEVVIDGDELTKHFHPKQRKHAKSDKLES